MLAIFFCLCAVRAASYNSSIIDNDNGLQLTYSTYLKEDETPMLRAEWFFAQRHWDLMEWKDEIRICLEMGEQETFQQNRIQYKFTDKGKVYSSVGMSEWD